MVTHARLMLRYTYIACLVICGNICDVIYLKVWRSIHSYSWGSRYMFIQEHYIYPAVWSRDTNVGAKFWTPTCLQWTFPLWMHLSLPSGRRLYYKIWCSVRVGFMSIVPKSLQSGRQHSEVLGWSKSGETISKRSGRQYTYSSAEVKSPTYLIKR
jgi:hypothetical protein